ncbi:hypothetical protein [Devosia sp. UYZn731]|uniref:hypothetical protein n=1 Tax=Devosia sp. UYZn731 TaxID=3156345 RepID=UPI003390EA51
MRSSALDVAKVAGMALHTATLNRYNEAVANGKVVNVFGNEGGIPALPGGPTAEGNAHLHLEPRIALATGACLSDFAPADRVS